MTVRPTGRGWSIAVLAVAALGLGAGWRYPGLIAVGAALALMLIVSFGAAARPGRLEVSRLVAPLEVPRFGDCTATLTLANHGRWLPALVDGVDPIGSGSVPVAPVWLPPGGQVERDHQVPTGRRGVLRVGPLRLRRYGVAGLAVRVEPAGGEVGVRVLPRVLPVRTLPPGIRRGHVTADERFAHGGTDLVGLREYLPGDDLRRLHWATTARTGTLMVREDADPSQARLTVILDDQLASYQAGEDNQAGGRFEEAVDVAASLAGAASAAGHPVTLRTIASGVEVELPGGTGSGRPAPELLAALAEVTLVEPAAAGPGPAGRTALGAAGAGDAPPVPGTPGDMDLLVLISGSGATPNALALAAGRAAVGVVLVVDPEPAAPVRASGPVLVLSAPSASVLLRQWDETVAGAGRRGAA